MAGLLALVGGAEWQKGCDFDHDLLDAARGREVVVLPTGAAYENPTALVETAVRWFESMGATVRPVMAVDRSSANDASQAAWVRQAAFIYLAGGSAMHIRSTLMQTTIWEALRAAWQAGAVVAGTSAGAMALCDPMVDPRGGAFTPGLGMVPKIAVIPHADTWSADKLRRTLHLAPPDVPVAGVAERTALVHHPDDRWEASGAGTVRVWIGGEETGPESLPRTL